MQPDPPQDQWAIGAALNLFRRLRARGADRAAPAARVDRCRRFLFGEFRIGATAGAAAGEAGGDGDGAGRRYGNVADTMAQTSARQGATSRRRRMRPASTLAKTKL